LASSVGLEVRGSRSHPSFRTTSAVIGGGGVDIASQRQQLEGTRRRNALAQRTASDGHPIESLASDLSSRRIKLHDLAGTFSLAVEIGFIDDI
jgi:hypothetical protein